MVDDISRSEVNRLYWESDESVNGIADRLDLSRRALYDLIDPRPAGVPCPECGAPLVYRNRTALENREAECLECGTSVEDVDAEQTEPTAEQERRAASLSPIRGPAVSGAGPALAGTLLLGIAMGALAGWMVRRG